METKIFYIRVFGEAPKIPIWMYIMTMIFDVGLIGYTFYDNENRLYGNIITGFIAVILTFVLAIFSIVNNTGYWSSVIASTEYNATTGITTYVYTDHWYTFQDPSLMWVWILVGIVVMLFTFLFVYEAVVESKTEGEGIE
jgi:hypothetical protein